MEGINVIPLIVDLIQLFYCSSRDALSRAKNAANSHPFRDSTGLTIFSQMSAEVQATVESSVASFSTIEATINYVFFDQLESEYNQKALDKWTKVKWKSLSASDRLILVLSRYGNTDLEKFQNVIGLFQEFVIYRNRIVHPYPSKYEALVEPTDIPDRVKIHAVNPVISLLSQSGLSGEIARIVYQDAARCYEIMLLVLALLDAQFVLKLSLAWYDKPEDMTGINIATPIELLKSLDHRYFPNIDVKEFVPEYLANLPNNNQPKGSLRCNRSSKPNNSFSKRTRSAP